MRRWTGLLAMVAILVAGWAGTSAAEIKMNIVGPGAALSAVAVSGLKNLNGDRDGEISSRFVDTLSRDLMLSGYFRLLDSHAFIEDPQKTGYDLGQFNFADWRSINADFLVKGAVEANGSQIKLTAMLFDVAQQRRMMGKTYTGGSSDVPKMARRFADAILKATTGVEGPFDTRLAFVSNRGGRFKEIYIQPLDGESLYKLTDNPTINLFPVWQRDARKILYLSFKTMSPALYLADPAAGREVPIRSARGRTMGGALSPDGQKIVAAIENSGSTNLYMLDSAGHEISELTQTNGINVSPTFSPDGNSIAFTSDRSGTPQIYVMSASGGEPKRITYSGNYNTTPAFSPDGQRLAYQSRSGGRFDIWSISIGAGEPVKLTDGAGSNEHPSWSPDGRYIAFSSTRSGRSLIYLLQVASGKVISPLTEGKGDDSDPAWSWWIED